MLAPSVLSAQAAPGRSSPACPRGHADAKTVEASGTFPFTIDVVRPVLDSVLTARGYRGHVSDASGTRLSQPKFTWPRGTEGESWHGTDSPGVEIMVRTVGRGDSTDFSVVSHVVCLSGDPRPESDPESVETRLEQAAAVEVASAVAEGLGKRVSRP
jgi:hypothetical protein